MKKPQLLLSLLIVGISVLLAVFMVRSRPEPPRETPVTVAPLVRAQPAEARSGHLEVVAGGTVMPRAEVAVASENPGKVTYVSPALVSGGRVRRGHLLVRIASEDFQNAVDQARAEVAAQEVAVLEAEEEARLARLEYERFEARRARRAAASGERATGILPPAELEASSTNGEDEAGRSGADSGEPGDLVFRGPQLRAAEAARARAEARLADAELALSRTEVRAPFAGVIRSEAVDLGAYVTPGQSLAQLVASDAYEISVPLTREEAGLIPGLWRKEGRASGGGAKATVTSSYGGQRYSWRATVDRAQAILDPQTRTLDVVLQVPDPLTQGRPVDPAAGGDGEGAEVAPLLVGDFVDVAIEGREIDRYFVLPLPALQIDDTVWVVRDGALARVSVQVLQTADDRAYVLAAELEPGEPVVVTELPVATDGMKVRLAEPESGR